MPFILIILFISAIAVTPLYSQEEDRLLRLIYKTYQKPPDEPAIERIYLKDGVLYCTGKGKVAFENNKAADLIVSGNFDASAEHLIKLKEVDALFLPFIYNLGVAYIYKNDLKHAFIFFKKSSELVPEYSQPFIQLGYICQKLDKDSEALDYYRIAMKRNPKDLNTLILMGDIYFNRNQHEAAKKYYDAALKLNYKFPNGLLGLAKIQFIKNKLIQAQFLLKSINIEGKYDKAYHYYYAETAFKLKDYETASKQYETLLTFQFDKFFLTISANLIKHKLDLSRKLMSK
jgi:tetratricopeptide (TPR) repeat protein